MKIEAHKNENKDLLVTFSDRTCDMEDLCVGIQKEWMDDKSPAFLPDWMGRITGGFERHAGRALDAEEMESLEALIKAAKVTDGVVPKD